MNKKIHILLLLICAIAVICPSCTDNPVDDTSVAGKNMSVLRISCDSPTRAYPPNETLDDKVMTLRILAFDGSNACVSNKLYNAARYAIIQHEISAGLYDFVFIANEPSSASPALGAITNYSGFNSILYSQTLINSQDVIPMVQIRPNIEVLANSAGAVESSVTYNPLVLMLSRLATRIDVVLEAEDDLSAYFKGVTFDGIADQLPSISEWNTNVSRTTKRSFTVASDAGYFSFPAPDAEQSARGVKWVAKMTRFILPFSNFIPKSDDTKAIEFTVDMEDRYSPSCLLKIGPGDYTLHRDAALLLTGRIKVPLELNIKVAPWDEAKNDWIVQDRYLNVSQIEANITDYNGARITFSSNLPKVHILPQVYVGTVGGSTAQTDEVFNDLVLKEDISNTYGSDYKVETATTITYTSSRFQYVYDKNTQTGIGYMDILLDEFGTPDTSPLGPKQATYHLVLSAEDAYGGSLQRTVKTNVVQNGYRFWGDIYGVKTSISYVGAFYRYNESGERIISALVRRNTVRDIGVWYAKVDDAYKDWIVLSTTPSFDPAAGTDNPGEPEEFPVIPNEYKNYNIRRVTTGNAGGTFTVTGPEGSVVAGRGRIYFRIGWKDTAPAIGPTDAPQYATVRVVYSKNNYNPSAAYPQMYAYTIYVRRGEEPDYLWLNTADGGGQCQLISKDRNDTEVKQTINRTQARKISPFNLTTSSLSSSSVFYQIGFRTGEFVEYPSQAGALWQWGQPLNATNSYSAYWRRAYHPAYRNLPTTYWSAALPATGTANTVPSWAAVAAGAGYYAGYGKVHETCPPGYHRPSDGYINQTSFNGVYPNLQITASTVSASEVGLYWYPITKTAISNAARTDGTANVLYSEWRQSLWRNPWGGEIAGDGSTVYEGRTITRQRTAPTYAEGTMQFGTTQSNLGDLNVHMQYGFYADGFFDRRPLQQQQADIGNSGYGVAVNTPQVAYPGHLFFNPDRKSSVFFPAAGRRENSDPGARLESVGSTGYYWSSSNSPSTTKINLQHAQTAWAVHFNYGKDHMGPLSTVMTYGYSIRCVRNEPLNVNPED